MYTLSNLAHSTFCPSAKESVPVAAASGRSSWPRCRRARCLSSPWAAPTQVTLAAVTFVTRAKSNLAYEVLRTLHRTNQVHDAIVWIGCGSERQQVRLISLLY